MKCFYEINGWPTGIYLLNINIKTLEQGVKSVQSY